METSDHIDREWRRTKPKKRWKWAKFLIHPRTMKVLVAVGIWTARLVWLYYKLTNVLRE